MEFHPSCPETATEQLSKKLISVSQAYITHFNNRDFAGLRSMSHLFAEGYTSDAQNTTVKGWDQYVDIMASLPPELWIFLKDATAEVDLKNGRADVFTLVKQFNRVTGVRVQTQGRVVWRREG